MPKPHVCIRVNCPLGLYEKLSAYRHEARHETRAQALVALIAAGLAALAKPARVPSEPKPASVAPPVLMKSKRPKPKQLVPFAGAVRKRPGNGEPAPKGD